MRTEESGMPLTNQPNMLKDALISSLREELKRWRELQKTGDAGTVRASAHKIYFYCDELDRIDA